MSLAPDVYIERGTFVSPRSVDIDTGKLMLAGLADRGPANQATESFSLADWVDQHGDRQAYSVDYDAVDAFFRDGGARLIYGRAVGPGALKAKRNLLDAGAAVALAVEAKYPGAYANAFTVQVTHPTGTTFQLIVVGTRGDGTAVTETSPEFSTTADAVAWSNAGGSELVNVTQGASLNDPAVLAASVLGSTTVGTDDRTNVTATEKTAALNLFTKDHGPGQVAYAGATDTATHALVQAHAETYGRVALLDAPDSGSVSTITAVAGTDRAANGARSSGLFAPWVNIPPLVAGGSPRAVPPSAVVAALMARSDGAGNSPNVPAAGDRGRLLYATSLTQLAWTDAQRATLNDAGVNVIRPLAVGLELYGYRTLADPDDDLNWLWLNNARFFSFIRALLGGELEGFQFSQNDSADLFTQVKSAMVTKLMPYYLARALKGATAAEAFNVDMSGNTLAAAQQGRLIVKVALKMSELNERTELTITKVPSTGSVS